MPVDAGGAVGPLLLEQPEPAGGLGVRKGERAAEVVAAAAPGTVVPGSRVDVLVTRERQGTRRWRVQDVEVLGVRGAPERKIAATLRVTPGQAVFLADAGAFAREIRLLARAPGDRARRLPETTLTLFSSCAPIFMTMTSKAKNTALVLTGAVALAFGGYAIGSESGGGSATATSAKPAGSYRPEARRSGAAASAPADAASAPGLQDARHQARRLPGRAARRAEDRPPGPRAQAASAATSTSRSSPTRSASARPRSAPRSRSCARSPRSASATSPATSRPSSASASPRSRTPSTRSASKARRAPATAVTGAPTSRRRSASRRRSSSRRSAPCARTSATTAPSGAKASSPTSPRSSASARPSSRPR